MTNDDDNDNDDNDDDYLEDEKHSNGDIDNDYNNDNDNNDDCYLDHKEDIKHSNGYDDDSREVKNCRTIGVVQESPQWKSNLKLLVIRSRSYLQR